MISNRIAVGAITLALLSSGAQADSLRDIYELALANDAQLKAEEAQYRANLETEVVGRSALLPQVNANYDYGNSDTDRDAVGIDLVDGQFVPVENFTNTDLDRDGYQVSLNQALFDLPAWFSFRSGKELTKQAEAAFASNQQSLIVRTVTAYLNVLRAQDNLEASKAQERAFERQLEQTRQRFEVGLIAITDVYESQAAYDLARVNRITDENNVQVALEQLSILTGRQHGELKLLADDFEVKDPAPADRSAWVDFALANNFQLQASRYGEEAARQTAKANQLEHLPTLTGNVTYSDFDTTGTIFQDPANPFLVAPDQQQQVTSYLLRLEMPLYTGGRVSAERRRAAQEFIAARENRINLERNTITNARSLYMTVVNDVARVAARKQSIVSSRSALDATQAGYEVGTRNIVDVLNAQNTLFSAERDYANTRYDYVINILQLKENSGLLSPEDVYRLDAFLEAPPPPTASSTATSTR